ncbi:MAG TPA: hypothetical protein VF134_03755 [Candidatus Dormibacteraeota bacterium]
MSESADLAGWFAKSVPEGWFTEPPEVTADGDEILVVGRLATSDGGGDPGEAIAGFRETSREGRMRIAAEAERRFGRKVAWGAEAGGVRRIFTALSIPVMTRLRMPERLVLDTLVEAGVARSRSDALAWCVRLVGRHQADWIQELRDALVRVGEVRRKGPV